MSNRKRKAIVAGSGFGIRAHVPALRSAGYHVVGLVGRDLQKTQEIAASLDIDHGYASLEEALSSNVDVVAIATPPHTHSEIAQLAFAHGAHVVCEKPFTRTLAEAEMLCQCVRETGLIGLLCHEFRYVPSAALFGRKLQEGVIGEPRLATFTAHGGLAANVAAPRPDWWFNHDLGGGWFGASGSHGIDRIRDWFGEIEGVGAQLFCAADRPGDSADDSFVIHFRTRSGVTGSFESTAAAWGPPLAITKVVGTQGSMWIDDQSQSGIIETISGTLNLATQGQTELIEIPEALALPIDEHTTNWPVVIGALSLLYRDLARMIDGREIQDGHPRPATFEDGLANMRVMDAIRESAAHGGAWTTIA